jgi:hypothetical protein
MRLYRYRESSVAVDCIHPLVKGLALLAAALFAAVPVRALTPSWEHLSDGGIGDPSVKIAVARRVGDSGMVVSGTLASSDGALTVKVSAEGKVLWSSRLAASLSGHERDIAVDAGGNVILLAKGRLGADGPSAWILAKLAAGTGDRIWTRTFGVDGAWSESLPVLGIDGAGNVVLATRQEDSQLISRWRIRKISGTAGEMEWQADRPPTTQGSTDSIAGIAFFANGDFVLTGTQTIEVEGAIRQSMLSTRLSGATGTPIWETLQSPAPDVGQSGVATFVAAGSQVFAIGATWNGYVVARLDGATGQAQWNTAVLGLSSPLPPRFDLDGAGDVWLLGRPSSGQLRAAKVSGSSGAVLWQRDVDHPAATFADLVDFDAGDDGHGYLVGRHDAPSGQHTRMTLRLVGADGAVDWIRLDPEVPSNLPMFIAAPDSGESAVLLAGPGVAAAGGDDLKVYKHASGSGALLWTATEVDTNMPDMLRCGFNGITGRVSAVDVEGSTFYAGCRSVAEEGPHLLLAKVSPAGEQLWWRQWSAGPGLAQVHVDLVLDAGGHVHLSAAANLPDGKRDLILRQLDGQSGNTLQEIVLHRQDQPSGGARLVFDPAFPDLLHATFATGPNPGGQSVIQRYSTANYALLRQYSPVPSALGPVFATLSGIDDEGNLVLIGYAQAAGGDRSAVQVLSAQDGGLLWENVGASGSYGTFARLMANGDVLVASRSGNEVLLSRFGSAGAAIWSGSYTVSGRGFFLRVMELTPDGDIVLGGQTADGFLLSGGMFTVALVNGVDGQLRWMDARPPSIQSWPSSLSFPQPGRLRAVGVDVDEAFRAQSFVVDYDLDSGVRLAAHAMGGFWMARYHDLGGGSGVLLDDVRTLDGARIRVRLLESGDALFSDGFDIPGGTP